MIVARQQWTLFPGCFTHVRTGEAVADNRVLLAGLLAEGLNLGLTRMAEACSIASLGELAWTSDWHIREETYALALRCLVNQQQREPFAAMFGNGTASSSDGQFFQAARSGRDASSFNAHYGQQPGFKAYTHLSDRYGPFFTKMIGATVSEALHVLDALLYHQSEVTVRRHHTDGGGEFDHVFALCALLGFQFAPRIPDLKHRRLYSFGKPSDYPTLEPLIAGRINVDLIRAHWSEILRIAASIRTGTVTASLIMRQLASYPRQNGVAAALRELGGWSAPCSPSTGSAIPSCGARPDRNSTRARHATAWHVRFSFTDSAKSAIVPTKTSSTVLPASTSSSPQSSCGIPDTWSAPSPPYARRKTSPIVSWPISLLWAGST